MKTQQNTLEQVVKKESLLSKSGKFLTFPFKGFGYLCDDTYQALSSTKGFKDWSKFGLTLAACAPIYTLAHEGMHALMGKILGCSGLELGLNPIFGGELLKYFIPKIRTDQEFLGGAYGMTGYLSAPADWNILKSISLSYAPYLLTILGVYLLHQGIKKNSPVLKALGIASTINLVANLGSIDNGDYGRITGHFLNGDSLLGQNIKSLANLGIASVTYAVSYKISKGIEYLKGFVRK
ncbi:hypothetical protein HZA97_08470 [Candidatus Woesearchaeota archaeon]|nr:hypothetical protein [Candidatus Woesearchaeota archaeon]